MNKRDKILSLIDHGLKASQIAYRTGAAETYVRQVASNHGLRLPREDRAPASLHGSKSSDGELYPRSLIKCKQRHLARLLKDLGITGN